jgi:MEMO1 family protein
MKKIVSTLFLCCCTFVACADELPFAGVREAVVADQFYPGDAGKLEGAVRAYLEDALPASGERPIALVAPHAGYVYSGQVAADAYAQAVDFDYDVVVILGTNHTTQGFDQVSVYYGEGYRTPLGVAEIDRKLALELMESDADFVFREDVHAGEHSVEVQVPFVQVAFPEAEIVTAVIGAPDPDLTERFGLALARVLKGRKALIVASSDLSHYPTGEEADVVDRKVLTAIASLDPATVSGTISRQMRAGMSGLSTCACGEGPILAAMVAAKALGATRGIAVNYVHSGGTLFGENSRVVGYGAVAFTGGEGGVDTRGLERDESTGVSEGLSAEDKEYLLHFARETIEQYLTTGTVPLPRVSRPALWSKQGAFVTLEKHGQLRGCIGHMAEDTPLVLTVGRMALQAALRDRRFRPVGAEEIPELELEISVLTPFAQVAGPEAIVIGRDGVVVQKEGHRAVYLPQVAPEQGWDREETLGHLCVKSGLGSDCWQQDAEFYTFQADVFGEGEEF